jgi:hypothetical protein
LKEHQNNYSGNSIMDDKGYEMMMMVFVLFYFVLLIPTFVRILFEDENLKEKVLMLEARICDLETELYCEKKKF